MPAQPFTKPPTTYGQQVVLLQSRGMDFQDPAGAETLLQHLNYYRLTAYWLPFEASHRPHRFRPGTTFEAVLDIYEFDRKLRMLMLDALERIEVSVRSQWAYQMAHHHGAHSHLDIGLAKNHKHWNENHLLLEKEVKRSGETFIKHLAATYSEPLPPVWAVCEVMSLGLLSRLFGNLGPAATRKAIALPYQVDEAVLDSWLNHLRTVRNGCAHHSRVWNRDFTQTPKLPLSKPAGLHGQFRGGTRKIYNTFVLMLHLMDCASPGHSWRTRLRALLLDSSSPSPRDMGFPGGWEALPIWR